MHFTFMISGVVLMLVAAFLAAPKKEGWFPLHKTLAGTGAVAATVGFISIFSLKQKMNYPHFASPHAVSGLTVLITIALVIILGTLAISGKKAARPFHIWIGRIIAVLLFLMVVSGIFRFVEIFQR